MCNCGHAQASGFQLKLDSVTKKHTQGNTISLLQLTTLRSKIQQAL